MALTYEQTDATDDVCDFKIENVRPEVEQISELLQRRTRIVSESELKLDGIFFKTEIEFEDTTKPCLASPVFTTEPSVPANEPPKTYECYICGDGTTYKTLGPLIKNHMVLHFVKKPFKCEICAETFSYQFDLKKHEKSVHNKVAKVHPTKKAERKHHCTICGYGASKKSTLASHIRGHTGERAYSCNSCPKTFIYHSNLRRHMKIHNRFKLYKCNFCAMEFNDQSDLNAHKNLHHFKIKPMLKYKCSVCNLPKASPIALKRHMVSHSGEKAFECTICLKQYTTKSNLKIHEQLHHRNQERTFACSYCTGRFHTKSDLKKHERKHAGGTRKNVSRNLRTYQCYVCAFTTKKKDLLVEHFIKHTDRNSFKCDFCFKIFLQESSLRRHLKMHRHEKPFQCNICLKMFWRDDELQSHMRRIHTRERPFKCTELCSRTFYDQADLDEHEKQHAEGKIRNVPIKLRSYQCYVCKCAIKKRQSLIFHLMKHTGQFLFECQICSKGYLRKACLQSHLRKHIGEKVQMVRCEICSKQFTDKSNLANHMQRHLVKGPYWCDKCSLRFKSKDTLYNHNRKHLEKLTPSPQKRFRCSFCTFSATLEETFISHMQQIHRVFLKCFVKIKKISKKSTNQNAIVKNCRVHLNADITDNYFRRAFQSQTRWKF